MTNIELATWAAALGTFAAAVAAVGTAWWSHRNEVARDERRDWERARDQAITDADETRRLLVIVISRRDALDNAELFGTIVHALDKHSRLLGARPAADLLVRWQRDGSELSTLEELIDKLTEQLQALRNATPLGQLPVPD